MTHTIGIRREDKNRWERRVPLTPDQVAALVREHGLEIEVEQSSLRTFPDERYVAAGATLVSGAPASPIVLGVKEIPNEKLEPGRVYVYFSHTIKGQPGNMPNLQRLLELGCTLIDYERIVDAQGRRLVFFGRHAGLAGMMDSLWALGQRLAWQGVATPLQDLLPTHRYSDLQAVLQAVAAAGEQWRAQGIPPALQPFVVGFTGYGNVSSGAQEVYAALRPTSVTPEALLAGDLPGDPARTFYQVVYREADLVAPGDPTQPFRLEEYYASPERYRSVFARHLPSLTMVINCIYWTVRYPRLVRLDDLRQLWSGPAHPKLQVFGDISCDIDGSIECTVRSTTPDEPVFVWQPADGSVVTGVAGQGPVVLAVDNLPCELPADASDFFGSVLVRLVPALAQADFTLPFEQLALPPELKRAVVAHRGALTPDYAYLAEPLERALRAASGLVAQEQPVL